MVARRRKQERSVVTRERLIEAALEEIHAVGLPAATTQQIARRAEVSRGALLHHFSTREDIILAAMEEYLTEGTQRIKDMTHKIKDESMSSDALVDFLWKIFSGRFLYLSLELIVSARTDSKFRDQMIPVVHNFHHALDGIWEEFCASENITPSHARVVLNLTLCLLRGMGAQTVLRNDPPYYEQMIKVRKAILPDLIQGKSEGINIPR